MSSARATPGPRHCRPKFSATVDMGIPAPRFWWRRHFNTQVMRHLSQSRHGRAADWSTFQAMANAATEKLRAGGNHGHVESQKLKLDRNHGVDPKGVAAQGKPHMSTVPVAVLREIAQGMGEGADKYGFHNWRHTQGGVYATVYYDAAMRHLLAWIAGEDVDPDSGINHVTKAITSLVVLRDATIHNQVADDRPPPAEGT